MDKERLEESSYVQRYCHLFCPNYLLFIYHELTLNSKSNHYIIHILDIWSCNYGKENLIRIWKLKQHEIGNFDELKCKSIMLQYYDEDDIESISKDENVIFDAYRKCIRKNPSTGNNTLKGTGIKFDLRCREILQVLDSVEKKNIPVLVTSLVHETPQQFSSYMAQIELQKELDTIIKTQIFHKETQYKFLTEEIDENNGTKNDIDMLGNFLDRDHLQHLKTSETRISQYIHKFSGTLFAGSKRLIDEKTLISKENAAKESKYDKSFCLACRMNPCTWTSNVDTEQLERNLKKLTSELLNFQKKTEASINVITKSQGISIVTEHNRDDFLKMKISEIKRTQNLMTLTSLDKELHDAYATTNGTIELRALHGYPVVISRNEAIVTLEREHNKLIATIVAEDAFDHVLNW